VDADDAHLLEILQSFATSPRLRRGILQCWPHQGGDTAAGLVFSPRLDRCHNESRSGRRTAAGSIVGGEAVPEQPVQVTQPEADPLTKRERITAAAAGVALLVVALGLVVIPPDRQVALQQCPNSAAGCIVNVDSDLTTFAAILSAIAAAAILIAILGIRFNTVKAGGAELGYNKGTEGLPRITPASEGVRDRQDRWVSPEKSTTRRPIEIEVREGLGTTTGLAPVAIARLTDPMPAVDPLLLRDYRSARKASQRSYFLTHLLGPTESRGQAYSVALRVTPIDGATEKVQSARFFFGKYWGDKVFEGRRGADGRYGIVTEAYGPFLALCEVELEDGNRILLDHYCDFEMGALFEK
jgi:hypothetical protein